jgi:hypothetical protein
LLVSEFLTDCARKVGTLTEAIVTNTEIESGKAKFTVEREANGSFCVVGDGLWGDGHMLDVEEDLHVAFNTLALSISEK